MGINYFRTVSWDVSIINAWMNEDSFVCSAQKATTGAPAATAGRYMPACIIQNIVDGTVYSNTGTTASPVWTLFDTGTGLTLPFAGTFSGTTTVGFQVTAGSLTTGSIFKGIVDDTLTTGGVYEADMGIAVTGFGLKISGTGVYTGTAGVFQITMNAATTGTLAVISGTGLTTGIGHRVTAAAGTLTTGRYYSAFDGALEVFGIGANGHIHSTQTTAPTITPTTPNGITAAAITAGGTDVCGIITTTGTQDGSGDTVLTVTFNKTYTVAPKSVILMPRNASASKASATTLLRAYISAVTATSFEITIPEDASAIATPSFSYLVIA